MATVTGSQRLLNISGNNITTAVSLEAGGTLLDGGGLSGSSNQVLISTGTGIDWVDGSGTGIIGGPYLPLAGGTLTGNLLLDDATLTVGTNAAGRDVIFRGGTSGAYFMYDASEDGVVIVAPTDEVALGIRVIGGAQATVPQFQVGRGISQYLGMKVDDRISSIIHRQDETDAGVMQMNQEIWDNGTGIHLWNWKSYDGAGASGTTRMTLNKTGELNVTTSVTAPTFLGDLGATSTINTGVTAVTKVNATNDTTVATTAFVQNLIGTIPAGLVFQGTWNAATNTPTLTSGSGTTGHFYIVSTSGSTNLDGVTDWVTGDWAVFIEQGGTDAWEKIDNSSVLDGAGTGQTLPLWSGSGTSNTLDNSILTQVSESTITQTAGTGEVAQYYLNSIANRDSAISFQQATVQKAKIGYDHSEGALAFVHGVGSFATAGMVLDATGVGIGTTSPDFKLDVNGDIRIEEKHNLLFGGVGATDPNWIMQNTQGADFAIFEGMSGVRFFIENGGNVGIGTASPLGKLQVGEYTVASQGNQNQHGEVSIFANSGNESLFLGIKNAAYPNRGWAFNPTTNGVNSDLQIKEHGATSVRMTIQTGGNVGIGTTSPAASLDIVKTSLPTTGKSYGVRLDMEKDSSTTAYTVSAFGLRSYVKSVNTGTNQITDVNGLWSKAEHTGTGPTYFLIGSTNRGVHNGSGNTGVVYGNFAEASIIGTGVGTHPYLVGGYSKTILNNINATLTNSVGHYIKTDVAAGAVTSVSGLIIDLDMTGGSVTGDLAYLKIQNDTITTTVGGTSRAINSLSALPSVFAGNMGIGTTNPSTKLHVEATTSPQVRIGYDANNYVQVSVSGTGDATIAPTGNGIIAPDLTLSAGSAYIKVDAQTNNVGIKTTNPRTALEVLGTVRVWSGANTHTYVETSSGSNLGSIQGKKNSDSTVKALALNPLGGNIGINLGAGVLPGRQLTLSGNSSPIISLKSNTTGGEPSIYFGDTTSDAVGRIVYSNSQDYISLWTAASERVRVTNAGDTGIGVTTPRAKLDVNGGVKVADDADTAALNKVGTLRYRYVPGSPKNFSYVDMCMQTGTNSYDWVNIVQNVWN